VRAAFALQMPFTERSSPSVSSLYCATGYWLLALDSGMRSSVILSSLFFFPPLCLSVCPLDSYLTPLLFPDIILSCPDKQPCERAVTLPGVGRGMLL